MWLDTIITQTQNHYVHSRFLVREPWAVPSRWTSCPRVGMYSLTTWSITLFIIIKAYTHWTIATASPWIEYAPSTVSAYVFTALGRIRRWWFWWLTRRLSRRLWWGLTWWRLRGHRWGLTCLLNEKNVRWRWRYKIQTWSGHTIYSLTRRLWGRLTWWRFRGHRWGLTCLLNEKNVRLRWPFKVQTWYLIGS